MMAPRTAPPIAAPPILRALSEPGEEPSRKIASVRNGTLLPSASTRVWKRTPSRALVFILPPRSTMITSPSTRAPAGIATRPSDITSRVTRASTRSSTCAVSLVSEVSTFSPTTDDAGTTTSTIRGTGGGGGGSGSGATGAVATGAGVAATGSTAGAATYASFCGAAAGGGASWRATGAGRGVREDAGVLTRGRGDGFSTGSAASGGAEGSVGLAGETTVSVSATGAGATASAGAATTGGASFWRTARYAPPAAAVTQAAANRPRTTGFANMTGSAPDSTYPLSKDRTSQNRSIPQIFRPIARQSVPPAPPRRQCCPRDRTTTGPAGGNGRIHGGLPGHWRCTPGTR